MFTRENPSALLVDEFHGHGAASVFARIAVRSCWPGISAEDWAILEDVDHEDYEDVAAGLEGEEGAGAAEGATLTWQDGALWAVRRDLIGVGEAVGSQLQADTGPWPLYCDLRRGLYDGPSVGRRRPQEAAGGRRRPDSLSG